MNECGSEIVAVAGNCSRQNPTTTTDTFSAAITPEPTSSDAGSIVGAIIGILVVLILFGLIYFKRLVGLQINKDAFFMHFAIVVLSPNPALVFSFPPFIPVA